MLRACVLNFGGSWSKCLPLIEFSYNNGYQSTIGMTPCEMLCGRKCRSFIHYNEIVERRYLGPEVVRMRILELGCSLLRVARRVMQIPNAGT